MFLFQLWTKVTELEEKGRDAKRLFGNRGCSLLQEERERKRVNTVSLFVIFSSFNSRIIIAQNPQ